MKSMPAERVMTAPLAWAVGERGMVPGWARASDDEPPTAASAAAAETRMEDRLNARLMTTLLTDSTRYLMNAKWSPKRVDTLKMTGNERGR